MTLTEEQELEMLREFFELWVAFHGIQHGHRQEQERAAQRMVDTANAIKTLKGPQHLNG